MGEKQDGASYLYDFIYLDVRRSHWYLSQLDPDGHLTGISRTHSESYSDRVSGKADAYFASLSGVSGGATSEGVEKRYDPQFQQPISLIEMLYGDGYVHEGLKNCPIGGLFQTSGSIHLLDVRMLRSMWSPIMKLRGGQGEPKSTGNRSRHQQRKTSAEVQGSSKTAAQAEALSHLPHAVQMHLVSDEGGATVGRLSSRKTCSLLQMILR